MLAAGSNVLEPPTSYQRKPRKCMKNHLLQLAGCDQPMEASRQTEAGQGFDRSRYNRLIGEMIQDENLMQCDDLPSLDELGYSDDFFRSMSTLKTKY
jgi:hypothetical protein